MSAALPIVEQIAVAVLEKLRGISTANNYYFTLATVERRKNPFNEIRHLGCVLSQGTPRRPEGENSYNHVGWVQPFEIEVYYTQPESNELAPDIALNKLWADVYKAVTADKQWGGLAYNTEVEAPVTFADGILVEIGVHYDHVDGDASALPTRA